MAFLVGNDFIPHLPHIHIQAEALTLLWDTYKKILPTLDGSSTSLCIDFLLGQESFRIHE